MVVIKVTERDYFLKANPDIYRMMQNDTSLSSIATIQQLRNLNFEYIKCPQLFLNSDIAYNLNSFDVSNFMKILLCMIVNGRLSYTLHYENCNCYPEEVEGLMQVVQKAFEICHARFIEYFSGILGVEVKTQMRGYGDMINEVDLTINFTEHYHGALSDTYKLLKMCEFIKSELVRNHKITRNMTQYQIAQVLFNWVVLHVDYDHTFKRYSFTGYSAAAYGYAVCQGFTALYNALCKCFGISIVGMSGEGINRRQRTYESHIWSFALLDGRNTYIDVTWGNPEFQDDRLLRKYNINSKLLCDFKHFNIPYNELIKEHRWDRQLYG